MLEQLDVAGVQHVEAAPRRPRPRPPPAAPRGRRRVGGAGDERHDGPVTRGTCALARAASVTARAAPPVRTCSEGESTTGARASWHTRRTSPSQSTSSRASPMRRRRGGDPRGAYPGVGAADGGLHGCDGPRSDRRGPCSHPSTTLIRCEERPRRPREAGHESRADPTPHDRAVRARAEIARARTLVGSSLRSWGLEDEASALELAVSELVTNAFVHGHGDILVHPAGRRRRRAPRRVRQGWRRPGPRRARGALGRAGGWGLLLLDELSDAWGAVTGPSETRVWMVKAASPGGATGDGDDR